MQTVFLHLFNMSITASWLALAVVLLRFCLKKAPKAITVVLWALVGVRLLCPFSVESVFSLIPSAETVPTDILYTQTPTIQSGIPAVNTIVNPILSETFAPSVTDSVNPMQVVTSIACAVWLIGIAVMLGYTAFSYLRLHIKVREATPMEQNVYLCDRIATPFILGVFRPRIYLPSEMNQADVPYVLAHESAHLKRCDHLWKPLGFLLLTVYWFNPVLWVAYVLLCRDIELACDEKVLATLGTDIKKPYSDALINCSAPRKLITACPLAFGESGVASRVKSVLHYKKPAFWVILIAVIASVVIAVCFLTDPITEADNKEEAWVKLKPLPEDTKQEIDQAFQERYGYKPWWYTGGKGIRYYGIYGDCIVLFDNDIDNLLEWSETEFIADRRFFDFGAFRLLVYRDGQFCELKDAYEIGILTQENIADIAAYHDGFQRNKSKTGQYEKYMEYYEAYEDYIDHLQKNPKENEHEN